MLLNILLFISCFWHLHARRILDEDRWNIKYMSDTNGSEFDRVIVGYGFDIESFEEKIPSNECYPQNIFDEVRSLLNYSGYVFCTYPNKGIPQMCPPGTKASLTIGGCVNKTTNTSVFPIGSRCASQPCQNGGICFDFQSADGYLCKCPDPYEGLHCHLRPKSCSDCGGEVGKIIAQCSPFTNNMALDYICHCTDWNYRSYSVFYTKNNCHTEKSFYPKCEDSMVAALPFTNKGFYICPSTSILYPVIKSCPLHHVWNDTEKECVLENN